MIEAILAIAANGVIGRDNKLPWKLRDDLKRFKSLTLGHAVLMGRRTYESIGSPLPGRRNIVLTRQQRIDTEGFELVHDLRDIEQRRDEKLFVIGGVSIFNQLWGKCDTLHITHVLADVEGDAVMSMPNTSKFRLYEMQWTKADARNDYATRYEKWVLS